MAGEWGKAAGRAAAPPTGGREVHSHAALRVIRPINLAGEGGRGLANEGRH